MLGERNTRYLPDLECATRTKHAHSGWKLPLPSTAAQVRVFCCCKKNILLEKRKDRPASFLLSVARTPSPKIQVQRYQLPST